MNEHQRLIEIYEDDIRQAFERMEVEKQKWTEESCPTKVNDKLAVPANAFRFVGKQARVISVGVVRHHDSRNNTDVWAWFITAIVLLKNGQDGRSRVHWKTVF